MINRDLLLIEGIADPALTLRVMPQDADVADFTRIFPAMTLSRDAVAYVCDANIAVTDWSRWMRICRVGASAPVTADPRQGRRHFNVAAFSDSKRCISELTIRANPPYPRSEAVFCNAKYAGSAMPFNQ